MTILENQTEIGAIIEAVQDLVGAVTGIRSAPYDPPDQAADFPIAIAYPAKGHYTMANGFDIKDSLHNIVIELHYPRVDSARTVAKLKPYVRLIPQAVAASADIAALCEGFEGIDYEMIPMMYGETKTFGLHFTITNLKLYPYGVKDSPVF